MRSKYYSSHAGMLTYLAQEFRTAATVELDGRRYTAYAELLDRIISDLTTDSERSHQNS